MINIDTRGYKSENIISKKQLLKYLLEFKNQKKIIGLTSGSFDLLHPGHIKHLAEAKTKCDILFVAIAKNNFSKNKKPNSERPIFSHEIRAFMVSQLKSVDFVFFDDGKLDTLYLIRPNIYIKGIDYVKEDNPEIIKGSEIIKSFGGDNYYTKGEKLSTTNIIKHIKENIK